MKPMKIFLKTSVMYKYN